MLYFTLHIFYLSALRRSLWIPGTITPSKTYWSVILSCQFSGPSEYAKLHSHFMFVLIFLRIHPSVGSETSTTGGYNH